MTDRMFFAVMAGALTVIAAVLIFGCTGCASLWWRDQEIASGQRACRCCAVSSWKGEAQGCAWWVCDGTPCPEKAP